MQFARPGKPSPTLVYGAVAGIVAFLVVFSIASIVWRPRASPKVPPASTPIVNVIPARPAHVATGKLRGTLIAYGVGKSSTGFVVQPKSGAPLVFFAPRGIKINGTTLNCRQAPLPGAAPDPTLCGDWPRSFVVGYTIVDVTFWVIRTPEGRNVLVSDRIDSARSF